ncbi:MAG: hypothetical protein Q7K65_03845 [Candidatus Buchananbacteria bacterium]|nr:hypothetical protein [Candidatus Buchananbacteria bacterium]
MFKMSSIDGYNLISVQKNWFKGNIYVDEKITIFPFQMAILEQFISAVIITSPAKKKLKFNFDIIIGSDMDGNEFSADFFVFLNGASVNNQDFFSTSFSALHWSLLSIFINISKLFDGLIDITPLATLDDEAKEAIDDYLDSLLPEELSPDGQKRETIN